MEIFTNFQQTGIAKPRFVSEAGFGEPSLRFGSEAEVVRRGNVLVIGYRKAIYRGLEVLGSTRRIRPASRLGNGSGLSS
ncbi:hypothetical protein SLA2020_003600 [Shorea laevis]